MLYSTPAESRQPHSDDTENALVVPDDPMALVSQAKKYEQWLAETNLPPERLLAVIAYAEKAAEAAKSLARQYGDDFKTHLKRFHALQAIAKRRFGILLESLPKATGAAGVRHRGMRGFTGGDTEQAPVGGPEINGLADLPYSETERATLQRNEGALKLADIKLTPQRSSEFRRYAALSDEDFERVLAGELIVGRRVAKKPDNLPPRPSRIEQLQERVAELEEHAAALEHDLRIAEKERDDALARADAFARVADGTAAARILELERELAEVTRSRNGYMTENARLIHQNRGYERRLKAFERANGATQH